MQVIVKRSLNVPLEAAEAYHLKAFGQQVKLEEMFDLSGLPELLSRVDWVEVLPVFIPTVNNREAVDSLVRGGSSRVPYEEVDVMKYTGSEASATPRLLFVKNSFWPDVEIMNMSSEHQAKSEIFWLPLKGYAIATGVRRELTDEYLDPETATLFPNEKVLIGELHYATFGRWFSTGGEVGFGCSNSGFRCNNNYGSRLAIEVPLRV